MKKQMMEEVRAQLMANQDMMQEESASSWQERVSWLAYKILLCLLNKDRIDFKKDWLIEFC